MAAMVSNWTGVSAMLVALAALGSGCVAVNIGKPDVFRHTETMQKEAENPIRVRVAAARVQLLQDGNQAKVQVSANVEEEVERFRYEKTLVVRRHKRLAFGLFPAAAETTYVPRGALVPLSGLNIRQGAATHPDFRAWYAHGAEPGMELFVGDQAMAWLGLFGSVSLFATVESLVGWPFTDWGCSSHDVIDLDHYERGVSRNGEIVDDASGSPKLRALRAFPESDREKMGVHTCFDPQTGWHPLTHWGVAGFHKYQAVFVDAPDWGPGEKCGTEVRVRGEGMKGPFEVELSIPGLGFEDRRMVGKGEGAAVFELPEGRREGRIEAQITVRECGGEAGKDMPALTRQAIRNLRGQASRFDVNLQVSGKRDATKGERMGQDGVRQPAEAGRGYEIVEIQPSRNGKYVVRAKANDASRTLDVAWDIEEDVRRRIREDFASRHPDVRIGDIRDVVEWRTEGDGGDMLAFTGWAFSARPLADGWRYDARTRRGIVRMAVSDGVPEEKARQWAKENIDAIVSDKNVAIGTDGAAPEGAVIRVRGTRFENGILTVGFEVVE